MQVDEQELKQVLADVLRIPVKKIDDTTSVETVREWDSLKHLGLVVELEERFNISFTEEQTVQILNYPMIKAVFKEHGIEVK